MMRCGYFNAYNLNPSSPSSLLEYEVIWGHIDNLVVATVGSYEGRKKAKTLNPLAPAL